MKKNYEAWQIKVDDFKNCQTAQEKNNFLVRFGILAPSSHNAQPWNFSVDEEGIDVFLNTDRSLPVGDANNRQSFISLGCAIENIMVAADYFGAEAAVNFTSPEMPGPAARVILKYASGYAGKADKEHLIWAILKRVSNRNAYTDTLPTEAFLNAMASLAVAGEKVFIFSDQPRKIQITEIALAASIAATADKKFSQELSRYVKANTTAASIGMPGFGLGMPLLISYIAPFLIRHVNINKLNHPHDKKILQSHTPCLVILASQADNQATWLGIGRLYEKIALRAVGSGLSLAMWAAPIQIGEYYKDLQKALRTELRPQAFFRIGYPTKATAHSPRLPLEKILK